MRVGRRSFLAIAMLLGVALAGALKRPARQPSRARLLSRAAIGRAYMAACPEESDAQAIRRAELAHGSRIGDQALIGLSSRHPATARAISADFATGRTRTFHGWVLSLTECQLCAAAALKASGV